MVIYNTSNRYIMQRSYNMNLNSILILERIESGRSMRNWIIAQRKASEQKKWWSGHVRYSFQIKHTYLSWSRNNIFRYLGILPLMQSIISSPPVCMTFKPVCSSLTFQLRGASRAHIESNTLSEINSKNTWELMVRWAQISEITSYGWFIWPKTRE